jgi:hypothetical protein
MAQWVISVAHFQTQRCGFESQRGRVVGVGPSLSKPTRQIHGLVVLIGYGAVFDPYFLGVNIFLLFFFFSFWRCRFDWEWIGVGLCFGVGVLPVWASFWITSLGIGWL